MKCSQYAAVISPQLFACTWHQIVDIFWTKFIAMLTARLTTVSYPPLQYWAEEPCEEHHPNFLAAAFHSVACVYTGTSEMVPTPWVAWHITWLNPSELLEISLTSRLFRSLSSGGEWQRSIWRNPYLDNRPVGVNSWIWASKLTL